MIKIVFKVDHLILLRKLLGTNEIFAKKLWNSKKYNPAYRAVIGHRLQTMEGVNHVKEFIDHCLVNKEFIKHLRAAQKFMEELKQEWNSKRNIVEKIIKDITGLTINDTYTVFITPPYLFSGFTDSFLKNTIVYGHYDDCNNYNIIYLVHEIFHCILPMGDISHSIQQLAIDNELRCRLHKYDLENKNVKIQHPNPEGMIKDDIKYTPKTFIGHRVLYPLMEKILPYWRKYLENDKKNILAFNKKMMKVFSEYANKNST